MKKKLGDFTSRELNDFHKKCKEHRCDQCPLWYFVFCKVIEKDEDLDIEIEVEEDEKNN